MTTAFLAGCVLAAPDGLPRDLKPFDLRGSSVVRAFRGCSAAEVKPRFPDTKFKNLRIFMRSGPSLLDCHVMVFRDRQSLERWDKEMSSQAPAWFSPLRGKPKDGVYRGSLGGMVFEGLRMPEAAIVGRFVMTVRPEQSVQYSRHNPKEDKFKLSNKVLNSHAERVMDELIRRAKSLS